MASEKTLHENDNGTVLSGEPGALLFEENTATQKFVPSAAAAAPADPADADLSAAQKAQKAIDAGTAAVDHGKAKGAQNNLLARTWNPTSKKDEG